ncbi:MAG: ANTAR domain-containing protein [Ruminococcus sp.]|nr:ANTAR domain-containing protein [Ruminococcus sp.]
MEKILIASSNDQAAGVLAKLVKEMYSGCRISVAATATDAKRTVSNSELDCVIINTPLKDDHDSELCEIVSATTDAACIIIAKADICDILWDEVEDFGAMVLPKPLSRSDFFKSMRFVSSARNRMLGIRSENFKLKKKLEEIRIVNRAKLALMTYLGFTEKQAHRYIEKEAMDLRCTKLEIAEKVIRMYEV